ncbi:MAG TPA: penicillin-binding protein 2, partial [Actinomycetota bacterium]
MSRGPSRPPAGRVGSLFLVMILAFVMLAGRLFQLQLRDAPAYAALARDQRVRTVALPATRGAIYDREGSELALSLPAAAVFANPTLIRDPAGAAVVLARALDRPRRELEEALARDTTFTYLARRVDPAVARK